MASEFSTSHGLDAVLRGAPSESGAWGRIPEAMTAVVPRAEAVAIALIDRDGLLYLAHTTSAVRRLAGWVLPDHSLATAALQVGEVLCCNDQAGDPRVAHQVLQAAEMSSILAVPLRRGSTAVGVIVLYSSQLDAFDDADVGICSDLAPALTSIVATCLDNGQARRNPTVVPSISSTSDLVAWVLGPGAANMIERHRRISHTLAADAFTMVFQPIARLGTLDVEGVEALARFSGPPSMPPDRWFADAAAVELGVELELAAVAKAIAALDTLPATVRLGVNVSPDALTAGRLLTLVESCDSTRLVLELTEHAAVEDYTVLQPIVARLRSQGVRLSIDDTGAGFASLTHVAYLRPDYIKLDRWIVSNIDTDPVRQALTSALVGFAHSIGAEVVGEGVETIVELQTLTRLGVDLAQGYYLARPANPPAIAVAARRPASAGRWETPAATGTKLVASVR